MNDSLKYLVILVLIASAGCTEFTSRPLAPGHAAVAFQSRRLSDENFRQFLENGLHRKVIPWPPKIWDFEMLTRAALYYHPDLDLARVQREIAEAGEITAAQRPNPSLMLTPTYVTHITAAPFNPYLLGVNPNIPIETAGKRDFRIVHARYLTESARLKIATTAWQIRSRLRTRLLNLYAAEHREALHAEQLDQQKESVRLLEER